jgi:cytochrome c oxidase subunit I+III
VLIGGGVFPILAGLYYYFPFATNKQLSERLGHTAFWFLFIGFNLTFLPMHFTGLRGMVRRVYTYPPGVGFDALNLVSSVGGVLLAVGFAIVVFDVVRTVRRRQYAPRNVWNAGTLEWLVEVPGQQWGVRSIPEIDSRYPLWDQPELMKHVDQGRFYLPDAEEGRRETLITSVVDALPVQCLRIPGPTFLSFWAAVCTGGLFIFSTFHLWWWAIASGVLAFAVIIAWLWTGTATIPEKPVKAVGLDVTLPLYTSGAASVGWWAMLITMVGDSTAFISLIFGYFFYWTARPDWILEGAGPGVLWPSIALVLTVVAWGLTALARRANRRDAGVAFVLFIAAAVIAASGAVAAFYAGPTSTQLNPERHAYDATVWVLVIWIMLHVALGIIMHVYCAARRGAGRMSAQHDIDIQNTTLYWHFVAAQAAVTVAVIAGFPVLA